LKTYTRLLFVVLAAASLLGGCGSSDTRPVEPAPENPFAGFALGRDDAFEAVTWNLHDFAEDAGAEEVALVAEAIAALGADVVAIQEIAEGERFDELLDLLPHHGGYRATSDRFINLGYVWLDSTVTVRSVAEVRPDVEDIWRFFLRWPLVLEITWQGRELALVNNHLKCCGDGRLEPDDPDDEEWRRLRACELLADHLTAAYPDRNAILLGDLNDLLDDAPAHNVFAPFLDAPDRFRFADMAVATGPVSGWSWGPGESHLDHILVNAPLFAALAAEGGRCFTVRLDQALNGQAYNDLLSDHVPVALVLPGSAIP
jgi:endonuclease/exonuclease/phosphatase family metal-dependent hydrolase